MRGLHIDSDLDGIGVGITPAHAGLTVLLPDVRRPSWDHPRACGAYGIQLMDILANTGSPPRMRGLLNIFE